MSSACVPTGTTKIAAGRLALIAMTAFFGQMPIHRVPMMRTCEAMACILQRPTEGRAKSVILLRPVACVELTGTFAAKQNDGFPRGRAGADFVCGVHRSSRTPWHSTSAL
jgi:hypothetical protein